MKRALSLLLVLVLVFSIAACATDAPPAPDVPSTTDTPSTSDTSSTSDWSENTPVTYTVYMGGSLVKNTSQWSDTPIGKIVEERTGVRVEIEYLGGAVDLERAALIVASGDYADIIIPHHAFATFRDAGAIIPIDDLYEENCPTIKSNWGDYINRIRDEDTGILWGLSAATFTPPKMDFPDSGFWLKYDAVAMNDHNVITTPDEYFRVIREYVEANPTTNGQPTIGFGGPSEDWRWVFATQAARKMDGWHNTGRFVFDPITYEATAANTLDAARDYFLFLNGLQREGLLDPEFLSQTHDEYVAKVAAGRIVGFYDEWWQVMDAFALIKNENRMGDYPIPFAVLSEGHATGMGDNYAGISALPTTVDFCISTKASDPAGILQFIDFLATDEMQELLWWGIEGEHFQRDENGRRYLTAEQYDERASDVLFSNNTGIGHDFVTSLVSRPNRGTEWPDGSGVTDPNSDTLVRPALIFNDMEKTILSNMGWDNFLGGMGDQWVSPYGFAWDINLPEDDDHLNDVWEKTHAEGEMYQNFFQHMIMAASEEDALAIWDDMQERLIADGIQDLEDYFTERVRQRVADWN